MKVPWQKERSTGGETAVQLRSGGRSTFGRLESYVPLLDGETALYREVREAVPVVDAAICKLIRLTGGVRVACGNERAEQGLQRFLCEDAESVTFEKNFEYDEESCWKRLQEVIEK